jgi:hypothetical protein
MTDSLMDKAYRSGKGEINEPTSKKGSPMKSPKKGNVFSNMWFGIKTIAFMVIVAFSFYSGMYVVSSHHTDPEAKMTASIERALASTEKQPVIVITPEPSIIERAKMMVGVEIERPVVHITTQDATNLLGIVSDEPGFVKAALTGTKDLAQKTWSGTKEISAKTYNWAKFWD